MGMKYNINKKTNTLLNATYILTGHEIYKFIENYTIIDQLDFDYYFPEWLESKKDNKLDEE